MHFPFNGFWRQIGVGGFGKVSKNVDIIEIRV